MQVWGYVIDPEDVESFALVSKNVYFLAAPFLREHARLKGQWSEVRYPRGPTRAAFLLEEMLLSPRIALYIKELQIFDWAEDWYDQDLGQDLESNSYPRGTMELIKEAIRSSSLIAPSEMGVWGDWVELGDEDPILALIVMQLTKLRKFCIYTGPHGFYKDGKYLMETLGFIAQSLETPNHPRLSAGGSEINSKHFPSLPRSSALSNVNVLTLSCFNIELGQLSRLLRSMKNLQSFRYFGGVDSPIEPYQLCSEVLECSQNSLKKLSLQTHKCNYAGKPYSHMGDITRFSILAELETDFLLLLGSQDAACRNLADVLPISIERVTLIWSTGITAEALNDVVLRMVQSKMKRLPNLKALKIAFHDEIKPSIEELMTEHQGKSADVGVSLSTERWCI